MRLTRADSNSADPNRYNQTFAGYSLPVAFPFGKPGGSKSTRAVSTPNSAHPHPGTRHVAIHTGAGGVALCRWFGLRAPGPADALLCSEVRSRRFTRHRGTRLLPLRDRVSHAAAGSVHGHDLHAAVSGFPCSLLGENLFAAGAFRLVGTGMVRSRRRSKVDDPIHARTRSSLALSIRSPASLERLAIESAASAESAPRAPGPCRDCGLRPISSNEKE